MPTYILDTNVFLENPNVLNAFEDCKIIIPLTVLEELDNQKKRLDEVGKNARLAIQKFDRIQTNMPIPGNGVNITFQPINSETMHIIKVNGLDETKKDNIIIGVALQANLENRVTLISNDIACRAKARIFGIEAISLETTISRNIDEVYSGTIEVETSMETIDSFYTNKGIPFGVKLHENQFVLLKDEWNGKHTALARYTNQKLIPLEFASVCPWDITPKNLEQKYLIEALLNPKIQLVTALGVAGTGKTLLALAAAGYLLDDSQYSKVSYYKSIVPIGRDLGALPGDEQEKLKPWMASAYDALELILGSVKEVDDLLAFKEFELNSLTYIRGRSLPNQFIIIDEAQNLTKLETKSILTRASENTKIVMLGDPSQIDHPGLDSRDNGLVYAIERFKDESLAAHITLTRTERSTLAELAAKLL